MKKIAGFIMVFMFLCSSAALAGGDKNQKRHDGSKGQGKVTQTRVNK